MKDYAKGKIRHENKFLYIDFPTFGYMVGHPDGNGPQTVDAIEKVIRYACAEAIADTTRVRDRRAARIIERHSACVIQHPAECRKAIVRLILGPQRKP